MLPESYRIYESFEIDLKHLEAPNKIYNKLLQKWVKAPPELVTALLNLAQTREDMRMFVNHLYDQMSPNSRAVYKGFLDRIVDAAKPLIRDSANLFCILHRGYSLN